MYNYSIKTDETWDDMNNPCKIHFLIVQVSNGIFFPTCSFWFLIIEWLIPYINLFSWDIAFTTTWVHPTFLVGSVLLIFLVFCVVFFVLFVFILWLVSSMLPLSLDCPFLNSCPFSFLYHLFSLFWAFDNKH